MKNRMLIAAALGGLLYLQSGFAWAANIPPPDQENTQIHDQQQIPGGQPVMQLNRTENDTEIKKNAANTGKEQEPVPVILRIKLINKTAD
ncbi:MAG: hypothetical protein GY799_33205 [Desulfobulbaceae bacterium]|nr:hypothetical protein [Desulfobulbaceae bacterium]